MRNYSKTIGALAAASTLVAGNAMAEVEGEVHVGYHNMYEFRFFDVGNDLVEAGVDLAAQFGDFGVSAGAWYGTWDNPILGALGARNLAIGGDELDLYTGVSYGIGDLTLEAGYIYYYFPDAGSVLGAIAGPPFVTVSNTQEVYVGLSYDFSFGLTAGTTWYYDFDAFNGWYWDFNLGYSIECTECFSVDLGAGVAFADGHGLQGSSNPLSVGTADGYQGFYASVALPWEFREGVTVTPYVKYTSADGGLAANGSGVSQDYLISGVTLAVGF